MTLPKREDIWLGLDIGGTKIAGGIVAFPDAALLVQKKIPTQPTRPAQEILDDCRGLVGELMRSSSSPVRGIGIGIAELIDFSEKIKSAATLPWQGLDVRAAFSDLAPTLVEADVRAAAFAEAHHGAGRGHNSFAYITVGTGISACFVQNGIPYAGARGNALTLGSSTLMKNGETEFVLERVASGPALVERYNEISKIPVETAEQVVLAMNTGDVRAREIVESGADALGLAIALYVNLFDPEAVVIGGGLGSAGGLYWARAVAAARPLIYADDARDLPILPAALGAEVGVIGAAALARKRLGNKE